MEEDAPPLELDDDRDPERVGAGYSGRPVARREVRAHERAVVRRVERELETLPGPEGGEPGHGSVEQPLSRARRHLPGREPLALDEPAVLVRNLEGRREGDAHALALPGTERQDLVTKLRAA